LNLRGLLLVGRQRLQVLHGHDHGEHGGRGLLEASRGLLDQRADGRG
jgi:hypothetical protein